MFTKYAMTYIKIIVEPETGKGGITLAAILLFDKLYFGGEPKFVEENTFEIIIPIENVPELQVGGNVYSETSRVPKSAEDTKLAKLDGQQLQIYNYVLANEAITTKEAKVLLGLQDRRAREILADMCDAGVLMKVGATSNLKYILKISSEK